MPVIPPTLTSDWQILIIVLVLLLIVGEGLYKRWKTRRNRVMLNLTDAEMRALIRVAGGKDQATEYARDVLLKQLRMRR